MEENITCQYCGKTCKNKLSKAKHEHLCKLNPDYEKHLEVHRNTSVKASKAKEVIERISEKLAKNREKFLEDNPDEAYKDYELTCKNKKCGRTFTRRLKVRHFKNNYRVPQFCCQACANSHVHSEEERKRTSASVSKDRLHICPKCGNKFMHKGTNIHQTFCDECHLKNWGYERTSREKKNRKHKTLKCKATKPKRVKPTLHSSSCPSCGKTIWVKTEHEAFCYECCDKLNKYHYQLYTKDGKRVVSERAREAWRQAQLKLVKSGKHKGWKSRNITSYPERFWINVLKNNGLDFVREKPVAGYFLDFVLQKDGRMIDLEIDGKQHKYEDRKHHDKIRDRNLRDSGYIVYRIDWNEINSKYGKLKMKSKIRQFLWWYSHQ